MKNGNAFVICCVVFSLLIFSSCSNSDINMVKNGTMNGYETTTIGKALDASFEESKWEAFEGEKGEKVVEFTGQISEDLHKTASKIIAADLGIGNEEVLQTIPYIVVCRLISYERVGEIAKHLGVKPDETNEQIIMNAVFNDFLNNFWKQGTAVTIQWIITPDGNEFNISYMSSKAWEGMEISDIFAIIYS